jgi:hypothetical protein
VLWQFFMAAYPSERRVPEYGKIADGGDAQQIKGANGPEKEGIPLKDVNAEACEGEGDQHAKGNGEEEGVLETRVICVFLSDWALNGGSERISVQIARLVEGWKAEGRFATRLKGQFSALSHPHT